MALEQIEETQAARLDQLAQMQAEQHDALNKSLEAERSSLGETVAALTKKVKIAYVLAGSAAFIALLQLLLNIAGVL